MVGFKVWIGCLKKNSQVRTEMKPEQNHLKLNGIFSIFGQSRSASQFLKHYYPGLVRNRSNSDCVDPYSHNKGQHHLQDESKLIYCLCCLEAPMLVELEDWPLKY